MKCVCYSKLSFTCVLMDMRLFQCWENCALLQANFAVWGTMCTEKRICVS